MSTLPRTRSLSGADTSSLTRNYRHDRNRPASLCEASWNRIDPSSGHLQDKLKRTPSQANNLCTTVPTSIVNRTLGGRHTPTRNSLRHSRMAVMARNAKANTPRRWSRNGGFGRVASLVIFAYILVGVLGSLLALWLLQWVPSLPFREVPHYSSGLIVGNGILASVLIYCLPRHRHMAAQFLKILLVLLLAASLLSCACICVFDTLHLINLAPMECRMRSDVIIQPASHESFQATSQSMAGAARRASSSKTLKEPDRINDYTGDDEEGSGALPDDEIIDDEEGFPVDENLEVETTPLSSFEAQMNDDIYVNVSVCVCYRRKEGWRIVMEYPKLTCNEVKNILPIFLVASCVVAVVGGVLSAVFLYLLWTSRKRLYGSYGASKPSETKPFIFKSNFKNSQSKSLNNAASTNGNHPYR